MDSSQNIQGLEWLVSEVEASLAEASSALVNFLDSDQEHSHLTFCLAHIHQVTGSLKIGECYGGVLLTEEMEAVLGALRAGNVPGNSETVDVLSRAIFEVPRYLRGCVASRLDQPAVLLTLVNDLRAIRNEPLASASQFFNPDLSVVNALPVNTGVSLAGEQALKELIDKLRQAYDFSLLAFARDTSGTDHLNKLARILYRLREMYRGARLEQLWRVAGAVLEGMASNALARGPAVRSLLWEIDGCIRRLSQGGIAALDDGFPSELLKNLLYYVTIANHQSSPRLGEIKREFKLDEALPAGVLAHVDGGLTPSYDQGVVQVLASSLIQEIDDVKAQLVLFVEQGGESASVNAALAPVIKRIADTLAMVGQSRLRRAICDIGDQLHAVLSAQDADRDALADSASRLLDVETALLEWAANYQQGEVIREPASETTYLMNDAQRSLIREVRNNLEAIKEAVVGYISSQWDNKFLLDIPELIEDIKGAIVVVDLQRPARIMGALGSYISQELIPSSTPPGWDRLNALADVITSVEYFLQAISNNSSVDQGGLLDIAERAMTELGHPVHNELPALGDKPSPVETVETVERSAEGTPDGVDLEVGADADPGDAPKVVERPVDDEDDVDDEIVDIFVEEAHEILQSLAETYPRWLGNQRDSEALAAVRRSFHSLKGSGRMVKANYIGELGFAVEKLFNKIIDKKVAFDNNCQTLVVAVLEALPALVTDFASRRQNDDSGQVEALIAAAEAIIRGEAVIEWPVATVGGASNDRHQPHEDNSTIRAELADSPGLTGGVEGREGRIATAPTVTSDDAMPDIDQPALSETSQGAEHGGPWLSDKVDQASIDVAASEEPVSEAAVGNEIVLGEPVIENTPVEKTWIEEWQIEDGESATDGDPSAVSSASEPPDRELLEIFTVEALGHINTLANFVDSLRTTQDRRVIDASVHRTLHMLKGSAYTAGVVQVATLCDVLEGLIKEIDDGVVAVNAAIIALIEHSVTSLRTMVSGAEGTSAEGLLDGHTLQQRLFDNRESNRAVPSEPPPNRLLLNGLLVKGLVRVLDLPQILQTWRGPVTGQDLALEELGAELAELTAAANAAQCDGLATLAACLGGALDACWEGQVDLGEHEVSVFSRTYETLLIMIDTFVSGQPTGLAPAQLIDELEGLASWAEAATDRAAVADHILIGPEDADVEQDSSSASQASSPGSPAIRGGQEEQADVVHLVDGDAEQADQVPGVVSISTPPTPTGETIDGESLPADGESLPVHALTHTSPEEDVDPEILAIFAEEAEEILEKIEKGIEAWRDHPDDNSHLKNITRELHTFKGGARVAGFMYMGDRSHDFETFLEKYATPEHRDEAFFDELLKRHDELIALFDQIRQKASTSELVPEPDVVVDDTELNSEQLVDDAVPEQQTEKPAQPAPWSGRLAQVIPFTVNRPVRPANPPSIGGKSAVSAELQEMVKIPAPTLDNLVNLAGETSITRGRVEQKIHEFIQSLDEMDATVVRLQDQIRRLGNETEAQIHFRREQIQSSDEHIAFDPLELDRYSQQQQLSRALQESASDLQDLKDTLLEKSKSAESLLLQQSRINTDLQENLMLTRMVPFSRLVPRLRRVVRQVSNELNKPVTLLSGDVDGDMDRTVLGKIVGPLEHMMRNAVDHGIEDVALRREYGKAAEGKISLNFGREGGEMVIRVTDDGKGLDVDAIKARAIERGLIAEDAQIREHELMQMIFLPGFSTSDTVSQVSGRGVGLDVVGDEVRQLGGSITISSQPGLGTEFSIRLPFTVSINSALLVRSKTDQYALPLNTIVGVVKVMAWELVECYDDPATKLRYGGNDYRVCYLGNLLNEQVGRPALPVGGKVALVLVATESHRFAVQVEDLAGSQEIVVKGLGPQFGSVPGLSGVTVMGDGEVVVILDLLALLRAQGAMAALASDSELFPFETEATQYIISGTSANGGATTKNSVKTVMVVDDSVTVRKVTTRFLEREGFRVVTARDGVDAVELVGEVEPDLMLLDIEMPRMDGFEVARIMRNSVLVSLRSLPIIMISSRTGEKHKDKAFACGVDQFLGKPYREDTLLAMIKQIFDA